MKKSLKEHWRMTKYSDECSFANWPLFMNIMDVKEVNWTIDLLAFIGHMYAALVLNYSFLGILFVGGLIHFLLTGILSTLSTIQERKWRYDNKVKDNFKSTLKKLGLYETKEGKNARKASIKHTNK